MSQSLPFVEVLEAADHLSLEEQETLIEILHRRTIERRRADIVHDILDANREFQSGECQQISPADIIKESLS